MDVPVNSARRCEYDVFLSFKRADTRRDFIGHLVAAMEQAGIRVFKDDAILIRTEMIADRLTQAIQSSWISMAVFSRSYADSRWCLGEIARIVDCSRNTRQLFLPIFYHTDPSDVRKQTGEFGEAFKSFCEKGIEQDRIDGWRDALTQAAGTAGFHLSSDVHESRFIKDIVSEVVRIVNPKQLFVAQHQVGLDARANAIKLMLCIGNYDVRIIGLYGMGGIGKTITARAIYNHIREEFECFCYLPDVKEIAEQSNGLTRLQMQLLSKVLTNESISFGSIYEGQEIIKERFCSKRTLLVIDDVDDLKQMDALAGDRGWFGSGSRIIITTRKERLLDQLNVDGKYNIGKLNPEESLNLFSFHALGKHKRPEGEFKKLADDIVEYANGLPLALEVLGAALYKRNLDFWQKTFENWKKIPEKKIHERLKISFDALDEQQKAIFLDIACFFVGMGRDYVVDILENYRFSVDTNITCLTDNCLLVVNAENQLTMHDLLRDMGREIVRQECLAQPGKPTRLWFYKDVDDVLKNRMVGVRTENIEAIVPVDHISIEKEYNTKALKKMYNLRLLQINNVYLTGDHDRLPQALHWICWNYCPLHCLPADFNPVNLIHLDLQHSDLISVWQGTKELTNLRILNLSHCKRLKTTPNFSGLKQLEKLYLEGCLSLVEVHETLKQILDTLVILDLTDCQKLITLPCTNSELKSKEHLTVRGWPMGVNDTNPAT